MRCTFRAKTDGNERWQDCSEQYPAYRCFICKLTTGSFCGH